MYVMLTVDLIEKISSEKREKFYKSLQNKNWEKLDPDTTWKKCFKKGTSPNKALSETRSAVKYAAKDAGVERYKVAAQAGLFETEDWDQNSFKNGLAGLANRIKS